MCPTLTVGSFFRPVRSTFLFSSFVQQRQTSTTSNLNNSNLKSASKTKRKNKTRLEFRNHTKDPTHSPTFFSVLCDFFETFWIAPKGPPFICFEILQHNGCQKIPKSPPFYIFRHCDTVQKSHSLHFFGKLFLVPKGPPSIFFIFCNQLEFRKARRVPLFTILSLRYGADFGRSRLVCLNSHKNCER